MTDQTLIMKVAQEASKWWADVITSPKFDIGADSVGAVYTEALATLSVKPITETNIIRFKEELYHNIVSRIDNLEDNMSIIYDVDYAPDRNLRAIAEHCNIPESNFPLKTTMWVYKDAVAVRYGYRAGLEYIYDSVSFWQRKLLDTEEAIKYWEEKGELGIVENYKNDIPNIKAQLKICINRSEN